MPIKIVQKCDKFQELIRLISKRQNYSDKFEFMD